MTAVAGVASLAGRWDVGTTPEVQAGAAGRATAESGASCVLAGRLSSLGRLGSGPVSPDAQAAAILAAYEREGASALVPLRGEFVLVLWDARRREGVIARDQTGGRSLHWTWDSGALVFAEELRDLLARLPAARAPDEVTVVDWLSVGLIPEGRSFYAGVNRLGPGHLLRLRGATATAERWWTVHYHEPEPLPVEALEQAVVAGMDTAVARGLEGAASPAVMLSGGLDSSCVAAGAVAGTRSGQARPVWYSGAFPTHGRLDESGLIDGLADFLGIDGVRMTVRSGSALAAGLGYLRDWGTPVGSPNHFVWRPLFARAVEDGIDVMLDGEGGDEIFGVSAYLVADRLRRMQLRSAVRTIRSITGVGPAAPPDSIRRLLRRHGVKGALPHGAQHFVRTHRDPYRYAPAYLRPEAARSHVQSFDPWSWKRGSGPLWWRHHVYLLNEIRELLDAHGYVRRRALEVGLEARHPFMHDVDLVELTLRLPPEPRFHPDHDRILVRRGMAGRLPDSVRLRQEKVVFGSLLADALAGGDGEVLRELLGSPDAEVRRYVTPEGLRHLLEDSPKAYPRGWVHWHNDLWRMGNLEAWLRSLRDPSALQGLSEGCRVETDIDLAQRPAHRPN